MNQKSLKGIYEFLKWYALENLEYPCDHCESFECEKNTLNSENIIKKRYKLNIIDWRHCLKRKKKELKELIRILKLPEFRKWSYEKCEICKKRFFSYNLYLHSETEIKGHFTKLSSGKEIKSYEWKILSLCQKCNHSYVHRKKPLYEGFEKL